MYTILKSRCTVKEISLKVQYELLVFTGCMDSIINFLIITLGGRFRIRTFQCELLAVLAVLCKEL